MSNEILYYICFVKECVNYARLSLLHSFIVLHRSG